MLVKKTEGLEMVEGQMWPVGILLEVRHAGERSPSTGVGKEADRSERKEHVEG